MEVDEGGEHLDVVTTTRRQAVDIPEDGDGVASASLLDDLALEHLGRVVNTDWFAGRDVEPAIFSNGVILIIIIVNIITSSRPS